LFQGFVVKALLEGRLVAKLLSNVIGWTIVCKIIKNEMFQRLFEGFAIKPFFV